MHSHALPRWGCGRDSYEHTREGESVSVTDGRDAPLRQVVVAMLLTTRMTLGSKASTPALSSWSCVVWRGGQRPVGGGRWAVRKSVPLLSPPYKHKRTTPTSQTHPPTHPHPFFHLSLSEECFCRNKVAHNKQDHGLILDEGRHSLAVFAVLSLSNGPRPRVQRTGLGP